MYTNQTSAKIRDQIFDILSNTHTDELSLDTIVPGIGYTRVFRKCLILIVKEDLEKGH